MAKLLISTVFNNELNHKRNEHMFCMIRANIGFYLTELDITEDKKFELYYQIDSLSDHLDLDNQSFKMLLNQRLNNISDDCLNYLGNPTVLNNCVDALILHFKLGA